MARCVDEQRGKGAVLTVLRVAETGSTNADMLALAASGSVHEGDWLIAERQSAGRGRQGRAWSSPPGNLYASGLVELRPDDPPASTIALVAGIAVWDALNVRSLQLKWPNDILSPSPLGVRPGSSPGQPKTGRTGLGWGLSAGTEAPTSLTVPTPTPPLKGRGSKLAGILLERHTNSVVIGVGINLVHHPDLPERPTISLAALGVTMSADTAISLLAPAVARWLDVWRTAGLPAIRAAWLERAHAVGTPLAAALPDGSRIEGSFDGLTPDCALQLRLADGATRVIHAGDVFLI